jgi:ubiquinone/menaquinone biosynthesis C-methylase UbiE
MTRRQIERTYDVLAPFYGAWAELTETRARHRALELAKIQPGESVLEVAVGTGRLFSTLARAANLKRCVGVEVSSGMLRRARGRLDSEFRRACTLCRADAVELPFPGEMFDVLFNCYMLDLLPEADIARALEEFRRVLKSSGRLVLVVMAEQGKLLNTAWMGIYRHAPLFLGGCRPVALNPLLKETGWRVEVQEMLRQWRFRSLVFLARPQVSSAGRV